MEDEKSREGSPDGPGDVSAGQGGKSGVALADGREGAPGGVGETTETTATAPPAGAPPLGPTGGFARGDWKGRFIAALKEHPVIVTACKRAGVSRGHAYRIKGEDEDFSVAWNAALEDGIDRIEQAAIEVAHTGDEEMTCKYRPDGSLESCTLRRWRSRGYQDRALILKANRPEKYRERYEVRHTEDGDIDREVQELARELQIKPGDKAARHPEKLGGA